MDLILFILGTRCITRSLCFPPIGPENFQHISAQALDRL